MTAWTDPESWTPHERPWEDAELPHALLDDVGNVVARVRNAVDADMLEHVRQVWPEIRTLAGTMISNGDQALAKLTDYAASIAEIKHEVAAEKVAFKDRWREAVDQAVEIVTSRLRADLMHQERMTEIALADRDRCAAEADRWRVLATRRASALTRMRNARLVPALPTRAKA